MEHSQKQPSITSTIVNTYKIHIISQKQSNYIMNELSVTCSWMELKKNYN